MSLRWLLTRLLGFVVVVVLSLLVVVLGGVAAKTSSFAASALALGGAIAIGLILARWISGPVP